MYYLLQQVSLDQLGQELGRAQLLPIGMVIVCVLGSLVTRAARWHIYFLPERRVGFGPLLGTLAISYMASTFLPLRAGELVRAVFLGKRESIAIPRILGTILLEKLFDFLAIGVMLALLLALPAHTALPDTTQAAGKFIISVIVAGFGCVIALAVWRSPTLRVVGLIQTHLPFGLGRIVQLERAVRHFADGTNSLREPRLWVPLLGWTAVTWVFSIATAWAGAAALSVQLSLPALLFLTVAASVSQAVPSSPGYVGVYHAAASFALQAFGVNPAAAIGIAIVTHAFSYGTLVLAGLIALWVGGYTFGDVLSGVRGSNQERAPAAPPPAEPWPLVVDTSAPDP